MTTSPQERLEDGFSLIELVIAMLIFAIIAVAILPAAIQAAVLSTINRDDAAANSFASGQLALIRNDFPDEGSNTCTAVRDRAFSGLTDPTSTGLTATVAVSACPASYPAVVTVTANIFDPEESAVSPIATMATQIVVTGS